MENRQASRTKGNLLPGDFFGEAALLSGEPRNATVTALTEWTVYKLHRDDFEVAIITQPPSEKRSKTE